MAEKTTEHRTESRTEIQRILVALDASRSSLSALRNAVELAERLGAELIGLFVEDINLFRLAQLPLAWEMSIFSPAVRRLESMELERQLRVQAERMRAILQHACEERSIAWDFQVTRGPVAAELLTAGMNADLMILGKIGGSFPGTRRTGTITRMLVARRPGMTLIFQEDSFFTLPVILLYDGTEAAEKAVDAACNLTKVHDGRLTVLISAGSREAARQMEITVMEHLKIYQLGADFRLMVDRSLDGVARRIRMEGSGPLVIPCDPNISREDQLGTLIDEVSNPVLLVR